MAWKKKPGLIVETVVFNGFTYRRYPNSPRMAHRRYFGRAGHRLHRDVWIFHKGPIPKGHQIHHIDGNTANNEILNLECLPFGAHRAKHHEEYVKRGKSQAQLDHLSRIQELAKAWHKSPEGLEWHHNHAYESMLKPDGPKPFSKSRYEGTCARCSQPFMAKTPRKIFCSTKCVAAASRKRRKTGP